MTHSITPPPELVKQWIDAPHDIGLGCHPARSVPNETYAKRLIEAAQWGANQELEACRLEIIDGACRLYIDEPKLREHLADELRAARRPKPPSLKEQALMALEDGDTGPGASLTSNEVDIIRRALEQLDD